MLTARRAGTYSSAMDHDINQLNDRLDILLGRFRALHDENIVLRNRVAALEGENKVLGDKVTAARDKVRGLLERLPQE
jgi:predicted  nucleic acid-binding Zn-ribbon protein